MTTKKKSKKRIMRKFRIDEISIVDRPAQPEAQIVIAKRYDDQDNNEEESADLVVKTVDADETAVSSGDVSDEVGMTKQNDQTVDQNEEAVAKQLAELTKRAERAEKVAELTDAQKDIFKGLGEDEQDAFLNKSAEEREADVAKADDDNPVVAELDGEVYRKNDDPRLLKQARMLAEEREARQAIEKREYLATVQKRAAELDHLPGEDVARESLVKAIDMLPESEREAAFAVLKAQDAGLGKAFERQTAAGVSEESPIDAIAKRLREADPNLTPEQAIVKATFETDEGQETYANERGLV